MSDQHYATLAALTRASWTVEEARQLMDGRYVLTGDNLMKMMAIYVRIQCGVPVVLMGECGCGKTMLIQLGVGEAINKKRKKFTHLTEICDQGICARGCGSSW